MSSFTQQIPGVLFQQAKHPLQGPICIDAKVNSSNSIFSVFPISVLNPSIKLFASFSELLRTPFGLPLIKRILIFLILSVRLQIVVRSVRRDF